MELGIVTCSGIKPTNNIQDLLQLGTLYPYAEFALQTNKLGSLEKRDKLDWFKALVAAADDTHTHLAMHLNGDTCIGLCKGYVPDELKYLWNIKHTTSGQPIIGRVQINIAGVKDQFRFYANKVADVIREYSDIEFIMQYTSKQYKRIKRLDETGVPFSILQDYSGGQGIQADYWIPPVLPKHRMGYAGGLGSENIFYNLELLNKILPYDYKTWVDAEKKLHDPETKDFEIALAKDFLARAGVWQNVYGYRSRA